MAEAFTEDNKRRNAGVCIHGSSGQQENTRKIPLQMKHFAESSQEVSGGTLNAEDNLHTSLNRRGLCTDVISRSLSSWS